MGKKIKRLTLCLLTVIPESLLTGPVVLYQHIYLFCYSISPWHGRQAWVYDIVRACVFVWAMLVYVFLLWKAISQVELINQGGGWEWTLCVWLFAELIPVVSGALRISSDGVFAFLDINVALASLSVTWPISLIPSSEVPHFLHTTRLEHRVSHWKWTAI